MTKSCSLRICVRGCARISGAWAQRVPPGHDSGVIDFGRGVGHWYVDTSSPTAWSLPFPTWPPRPLCHHSASRYYGLAGRLTAEKYGDMSTSCVIPTNEHLVAPPPARRMPALHRFTAVYRCAIPPLHGRDGRQRRSWATFPFGRFACMTSPSASSLPLVLVSRAQFLQ